MPQPFFLELSGLGIHRSDLLKLGVEIYSYNDHVRLLSPEPVGWIQHHQLYSSGGADIVMESITLKTLGPRGSMSVIGIYRHLRRLPRRRQWNCAIPDSN